MDKNEGTVNTWKHRDRSQIIISSQRSQTQTEQAKKGGVQYICSDSTYRKFYKMKPGCEHTKQVRGCLELWQDFKGLEAEGWAIPARTHSVFHPCPTSRSLPKALQPPSRPWAAPPPPPLSPSSTSRHRLLSHLAGIFAAPGPLVLSSISETEECITDSSKHMESEVVL